MKAGKLVPRMLPSLYGVLKKYILNEGIVEAFIHSNKVSGLCTVKNIITIIKEFCKAQQKLLKFYESIQSTIKSSKPQ